MTDGAEKTISVPEGGRGFRFVPRRVLRGGETGQHSNIRIGRLLRMPVRVLERMLDSAGEHVRNNGAEAV
jgi:hypothetical protein